MTNRVQLIAVAGLLAAGTGMNIAEAQARSFNIPAEPIDKAIADFARQSGLQIVAPTGQLHDTIVPALQGSYDTKTALQLLLAHTGLEVSSDNGSVVVLRVAAGGNPAVNAEKSGKLEEVTVTAERRIQNMQKVGATVAVITGADIEAQGKITTAQILEDVPNVVIDTGAEAGDNPNGNITIRGIPNSPSQAGVTAPSTTATYVDDVYEGIGGDFDISRVEVLYGPQGTLYGRSATGGVVAFHTNDPQLGKFGGYVTGEYGSADLRQAIAAVNLPIVPQLALRIAAREFDQHGYYESVGGATRTQEARVKLLYKPLSNLSFIGAWTIEEQHINSGGAQPVLSAPNTILYAGPYTVPTTAEDRFHQYSLTTKYNFGYGTATYIGALHDYDSNSSSVQGHGTQIVGNVNLNPLDQTHTEELRLASNAGSPLTWLVGANFYADQFKSSQGQIQAAAYNDDGTPDTTAGIANAPISTSYSATRIFDYGLFTEETYPVLSNLRITAGARVDESKVSEYLSKEVNTNVDANNNALSPAVYSSGSLTSSRIFRNFTYKLRAEYDLAPQHMVYATIGTGFLPGEQQLAIVQGSGNAIAFQILPYTQEILRSYEIGSKNRFLGNTLQINGDVFYQHYSGYQLTVGLNPNVPTSSTLIAVPLQVYGAELSAQWLFTPADRFSFAGGITDSEVPGDPILPGAGPVSNYIQTHLSGVIPYQFTAAYTHTITFADGSSLQPRGQARFYGPYNLTDLIATETAFGEHPYVHQDSTVVADVDLDWTSPNGKYSVDGYVRNIANNIYKASVQPSGRSLADIEVTPSNPRIAGVVVTAKF